MRTTKTSCGTFPELEALANYLDCHNIHKEGETLLFFDKQFFFF